MGIGLKVHEIYNKKKGNITPTLLTKILLGTLACIPAYDTNFIKAIKKYKNGLGTPSIKSIEALSKFYEENKDSLNKLTVNLKKMALNIII